MITNLLKKHFDTLVASAAGFCIVVLFSRYGGIGISPDSIAYSSTARNLVAGHGFTYFSGEPLVLFPLFYPFFLGVVMFLAGSDIIVVAPFLNAFLMAMVVFLSGIIMEQFKYKTRWYKWMLLAIITVSPSLIEIFTMLWSETLFIMLSLVFILQMHHYFKTHSLNRLLVAAGVATVAFDTRYAGVTLAATGCLLLFFDEALEWKKRWLHIFVFGSIASLLVVSNLVRNAVLGNHVFGMRQPGITPFDKNVEISGTVFSDWMHLQLEGGWGFELLSVAVFLFFLVFFIKNILHRKSYHTTENVAVSFFIVYVLFIVVSSTVSRYETINNRLLAPAFLPFCWISTCQIPKWLGHLNAKWLRHLFVGIMSGAFILLLSGYMYVNIDNYSWMSESGIPGFNDDTWTKSDLVVYLQEHPEILEQDNAVFSNFSQAIYWFTGKAVESLPERVYAEEVGKFRDEEAACIIWFDMYDNPDLLDVAEIGKYKSIARTLKFRDGRILYLTEKAAPQLPPSFVRR
ncbi:MAG TPA: hypothetical protein VK152_05265 [Paludibacter sp.]|nr:hypothetical protein [Paludibacter sp.]